MRSDTSVQTLARLISQFPTLNDELAAEKLLSAGVEEDVVDLALALIPVAFARVLFTRTSFALLLRLTDDADIGRPEEGTKRVALTDLPLFRDAYELAVRSAETGIFDSSETLAIAGRSAEFHLVSMLLIEKKNLAEFTFSRPLFPRIRKDWVK